MRPDVDNTHLTTSAITDKESAASSAAVAFPLTLNAGVAVSLSPVLY
jgi:hypothetical protein